MRSSLKAQAIGVYLKPKNTKINIFSNFCTVGRAAGHDGVGRHRTQANGPGDRLNRAYHRIPIAFAPSCRNIRTISAAGRARLNR